MQTYYCSVIALVIYSLLPQKCQNKKDIVEDLPKKVSNLIWLIFSILFTKLIIIAAQASISGVYQLESVDDNYGKYLLAMDIPQSAVDVLARS